MKPIEVRRWVHRIIGTAALVLICTGTLVTFPDFRNALIGGHGQTLSDVHMWLGFIFVFAPIVGLMISGKQILANIKKRVVDAKKMTWRRFHLSLTIFSGSLMATTGGILLFDSTITELPIVFMDAFFWLHLAGAWILGMTLPIHLWMSRRGIVHTLKKWCGLDKNGKQKKLTQAENNVSDINLDQGLA